MLWFRCYNEMRNDTKLRLIAAALDTEEAFVHGMWIDVLCLAVELDQDWHLRIDADHPLSFEQVAAEVRVKRVTGSVTPVTFLAAAVDYGLIEETDAGLVIASGKRRNAKPSDSKDAILQRVHRHRDKKKAEADPQSLKRPVTRSETPQEVEVEVELNHQSATHSPPPASKRPVVAAPDWQARSDALLEASHFPSDLMQLGELLAAGNKTGKAQLSRIVRELYEPIVALQDELPDAAIRYGLRAALTKGAPNANYVKRAAQGYQGNGHAPAPPATNSYQDELTQLGRDFLTETWRDEPHDEVTA